MSSVARVCIPACRLQKASPRTPSRSSVRPQSRARATSDDEPVFDTLTSTTSLTSEAEAAPSLIDGIKSVSDFTGKGYTGGDSAGQSNIFSVEPKMYVAEENDKSAGGTGALAGVIASLLALAAATINGVILKDSAGVDEFSSYTGDSLTVVYAKVGGSAGSWVNRSAPSPQDQAVADAAAEAL